MGQKPILIPFSNNFKVPFFSYVDQILPIIDQLPTPSGRNISLCYEVQLFYSKVKNAFVEISTIFVYNKEAG